MTKTELEALELTLTKLQHAKNCPVRREGRLCECSLSEGRRRLYNYIAELRQQERIEENVSISTK